jgi:hypothetical protein
MFLTITLCLLPMMLGAAYINWAVHESDKIVEKQVKERYIRREVIQSPLLIPGPQWQVKTRVEPWEYSLVRGCRKYTALVVKIERKGSVAVTIGDVDASDAGAEEKVRSLVLQADSRCAFMNAQEVR